jgi:hypothetical protein
MTPSTKLRSLFRATAVAATLTALAAGTLVTGAVADAASIPKFKQPKVFGTSFQTDPNHDFSKGISTRHDGILRGWVTHYKAGVAEYSPIKWVKSPDAQGHFVSPPEGDVTAYASPISAKVKFYSAYDCKSGVATINRQGVGNKRCSRKLLISRLKNQQPALITVYKGEIIKFQEIYVP